MRLICTELFAHDGREYEVRVTFHEREDEHRVQPLENRRPLPWRCGVPRWVASDLRNSTGLSALDEVVKAAKGYIVARVAA